ncbi:MAG: hypothetical protein ACI82I_002843 [Gammaproteobacteria bacterium]|jgi:hypothetical protein
MGMIKKRISISTMLFVVAAFFTPSGSHALQLSDEERQLIIDFENLRDQPFEEFFTEVVHQREFCPDINAVCEVPLQKRSDNFHVVFRGQNHMPTDHAAEAVNRALSMAFDDIGFLTNNWPIYEKPQGTQKYIYFVFVNRETFEEIPEIYIQSRIAHKNFTNPEIRERMFRNFMKSDVPCMHIASIFDDGVTRASHIWVKTELSDRLLGMCIAEELFNSMGIDEGVDVDSTFDWPLASFDSEQGLSDLHRLLLKLLYQPDFKQGQNKDETRKVIENLLSTK